MSKKGLFCSITQSFFDLEKKCILVNPPNQAKIIGVFKVKFCSKINFLPLFSNNKIHKNLKMYAMSENG